MTTRSSRHGRRTGIALSIVIICLMVITALVAAMLRNLSSAQRQTNQQWNAVQAAWLAESGVERAMFLLGRDADYGGETWLVRDKSFGERAARVEIQVTEDIDAASVQVRVRAVYPEGSPFSATARRNIVAARPGRNQDNDNNDAEGNQDAGD